MDLTFNLDPNTVIWRDATELVSVEIHLRPGSCGVRLMVKLHRDEPEGISAVAQAIAPRLLVKLHRRNAGGIVWGE